MAAFITGTPAVGQPGDIHDSALNPLGMIVSGIDADGLAAEYIYLKGVASTVAGTWVTFDELGLTTRAVANAQGGVAVATAAVVASKWGWYHYSGQPDALCLASFADNGKVYLTATDGSVDDADVSGDVVYGAIGRSARDTTTGMAVFEIHRPFVMDLAAD